MADRFLVAPINAGLQNNVKPFLIPDDAFARLSNAFVFRSRIKKRFGSQLLNQSPSLLQQQLYSRLRVLIGTTNNTTTNIQLPGSKFEEGQQLSIGNVIFTIRDIVAGVAGIIPDTQSGSVIVGSVDMATGVGVLSGTVAGEDIYYYPCDPVMGLPSRELPAINSERLMGFDTQFSYHYVNGAWERLATGDALWTGTDSEFFYTCNWNGANSSDYIFFATNFNPNDGLRYFDGSTWTKFTPNYTGTANEGKIITAKIVLPFKDRLILLNTIETIDPSTTFVSFPQRCRFSINGTPLNQTTSWDQVARGRAGYIDAPTKEAIVSAEFINDRLIVYFEQSTWELVYTRNQALPFVWQKINTELGANSTYSVIPFDQMVLAVGRDGINACTGANVQRIDNLIPNEVFSVSATNNGLERIYGIRDYYTEVVYWTFSNDNTKTYPNILLVYNYENRTWATFDDSITCFGYFNNSATQTWAQAKLRWRDARRIWASASLKDNFRQIVAGNQQGWTFICSNDITTRNAPALSITKLESYDSVTGLMTVYSPNHNLTVGAYIIVENLDPALTQMNDIIFQVFSVIDENKFTILVAPSSSGVPVPSYPTAYTSGGTIALVSQIDILTKQYNFYLSSGRSTAVNRVDFLVDRTSNGAITVDYFVSSSDVSYNINGTNLGVLVGTGVLETSPYTLVPLEQAQQRLWHSSYPLVQGQAVQMRFYLNEEQMTTREIVFSNFELHAFLIHAYSTSAFL